jgi:hypothetical protein
MDLSYWATVAETCALFIFWTFACVVLVGAGEKVVKAVLRKRA